MITSSTDCSSSFKPERTVKFKTSKLSACTNFQFCDCKESRNRSHLTLVRSYKPNSCTHYCEQNVGYPTYLTNRIRPKFTTTTANAATT